MPDRDDRGAAWLVPPSRYLARRPPEFAVPKPTSLYKPGEPGSIHGSYDRFPYTIASRFDWLADRVGATGGGGG